MGLGHRQARHDTAMSRAAGFDTAQEGDFAPGEHVMTIDKIPGVVVGVQQGFTRGDENYEVKLENGMGAGTYSSSQLSRESSTQREAREALGSATIDYPELGTILVDRPDPGKIVTYASKKTAAEKKCPLCSEMVNTDFGGMARHMKEAHGVEKSASINDGWSMIREAAKDPSFGFHVTAAWADVRNKAKRIRNSGGVHIAMASEGMIVAEVRGDHGVYESGLQRLPGRTAVSQWSCGCFLADAPITLADGSRVPVSQLQVGDNVITHEGNIKPVVKAWEKPYRGTKSTVMTVGDHEPFVATGDHKVWAKKNDVLGWYEIQELAVGDMLSRTALTPDVPLSVWVAKPQKRAVKSASGVRGVSKFFNKARPDLDLWVLRTKDGGRGGIAHSRYFHSLEEAAQASNEHYSNQGVSVSVDSEIARLIGWYAAEGHFRKSNYEIGWTLNINEQDVAEQILDICYRRFGVEGSIRQTGENKILCRVSSWKIHGLLTQLVRGDRAPIKRFDQRLLTLPRREQQALISALIGGDGNYSQDNGVVSISSSSETLLRQSRDILLRLNEMSSIRLITTNNSGGLETTKNAGSIYRLSWSPGSGSAGTSNFRNIEDGVLFSKITKTETVSFEGEVWDVEVADDHSFRAFDVNVHNCKWGAYHWGADDDLSRFAGRMCSHALALQYEAQSRGMFGRNIEIDDTTPKWVPKTVQVKYDIDSGKEITAPSSRVGSVQKVSEYAPLSEFLARFEASDERSEALLMMASVGLSGPYAEAAVSNAWGKGPNDPDFLPGAFAPHSDQTNPASTGWASHGDPEQWQEAAEHPKTMADRVASLIVEADSPLNYAQSGPSGIGMPGLPNLKKPKTPNDDDEEKNGEDENDPAKEGEDSAKGAGEDAAEGAGEDAAEGAAEGAGESAAEGGLEGMAESAVEMLPDALASLKQPHHFFSELHDHPEGALPSTDGGSDDEEHSEEGLDEIVASFQRTAAAASIMGSSENSDVASAAQDYLKREALKAFSPAEQQMIINEGSNVRARNTDKMDISGTHYEDLDDESWLA